MSSGEFGAARFFLWRKLHEFDSGKVGIVKIELPFAIAADFGFFGEWSAVFAELFLRGMDVGNAESDVIHYAEEMFVLAGRVVQHQFEPVSAVGNLEGDPGGFVVFHPAVPVGTETKDVFVEMFHGCAIADNEAGVDDSRLNGLMRRRGVL